MFMYTHRPKYSDVMWPMGLWEIFGSQGMGTCPQYSRWVIVSALCLITHHIASGIANTIKTCSQ